MFLNLRIQDFLSIQSAEIPLSNLGLVLVEGVNRFNYGTDSNGAGKSSIFEAILWVLYESTVRGFSKDEVIRAGSPGCCVELNYGTYLFRRARKHPEFGTGFWVFESGTEVTLSAGKGNERSLVQGIVGLDLNGFLYTMMMGQGATQVLCEASDKDQKTLYESIILSADFPTIQASIKADRLSKETEISVLTASREAWKAAADGLELSRISLESKRQAWESSREANIRFRQEAVDKLLPSLEQERALLVSLETLLQESTARKDQLVQQISGLELREASLKHTQQTLAREYRDAGTLESQEARLSVIDLEIPTATEAFRDASSRFTRVDEEHAATLAELNRLIDEIPVSSSSVDLARQEYHDAEKRSKEADSARGLAEQARDFRKRLVAAGIDRLTKDRDSLKEGLASPKFGGQTKCPVCFQDITEATFGSYRTHVEEQIAKIEGDLVVALESLVDPAEDAKILELSSTALQLFSGIGNANMRLNAAIRKHQDLLARKKQFEETTFKKSSEAWSSASSAKTSAESRIAQLQAERRGLLASVEPLRESLGTRRALATILADNQAVVQELAQISENRISLSSGLDKLQKAIQELMIRIRNVKTTTIPEIETRYRAAQDALLQEKAETNPHHPEALDLDISQKRKQVEEVGAQLISLQTLCQHLAFLEEMFGDKGLKSYLMDFLVAPLNSAAAFYSNLLAGGEFLVEFSTVKYLKNGSTRDAFNIQVFNKSGSPVYGGNSGGERKKINLIILQSVRKVLRDRTKFGLNCAFYDEFDGALDRSGKELVFSMMEREAEDLGTVFVITHDDGWKARFQEAGKKILTVVKGDDGISRVQLGW